MKNMQMDIRGQICPSSLLLVLREVNRQYRDLMAGQLCLMILTDSRDATGTIPEAVNNMGVNAVVAKMDGYYCITIQKKQD